MAGVPWQLSLEMDGQPGRRKARGSKQNAVMLLPGASAGSWVTSRDLEPGVGPRGGGDLAWGHVAHWLAGHV